MSMRVLVLAYFYPPVGGAGVQRWVRMVRHLPESGVHPIVLTGSGAAAGSWRPADATTPPPDVPVHRARGPEPKPMHRRIGPWLRRPDAWSRWWRSRVLEDGTRVGHGCSAIIATMSPFETAEPAAELSRRLGVPWIADLRDPWAIDEMRIYQTGLHRRLEVRSMAEALRTADAVVMNTAEARTRVIAAGFGLQEDRVYAIPNGAYPAQEVPDEKSASHPGRFTITHAGKLHTAAGLRIRRQAKRNSILRGGDPCFDLLPRSHAYLLEALSGTDGVLLELIGQLTDADRMLLNRHPTVAVDAPGFLGREESRRRLERADMLFLPMHHIGGKRATIVPEKTYEYLASGRPLLAAVPPGDARDLLTGHDRVYVCDPRDTVSMRRAIQREMAISAATSEPPARHPESLAAHHPAHLAARMAAVIDATCRRSAEPGSGQPVPDLSLDAP